VVSTRGDSEAQLRNLRSVTDSTLARLTVDELLVELLDRVRGILEADTAAVLLLEGDSDHLVARAACGIEEEVRQGVRVPLGVGFAGRIARLKQPVALDRVNETTVSNPILWEKGIRVMLGTPLLLGEQVIGVLHVGRLHDDPFTAADTELLEVVAERVAGAVHSRQLAMDRAAATLLERSLLPGRLPDCPGLELAARYLTPDEPIGGDWYDVFTLPDGKVWVVTGDVAGHGMEAAVVMGRVRSALRAYALLGAATAEVVELTSRKVQHFEIGTMVTVLCAAASFPYGHFDVASAGHPPPVVALPGQAACFAELTVGPPLGLSQPSGRTSTRVSLPQGAVMLLYTDGLIERRGEDLDVGLERLRTAVHADHPDNVCRQVTRRLIPAAGTDDDVAMVAVRRGSGD
jgi:hypothetical protein